MNWKRKWDGKCLVYKQWEKNGVKWTVGDLHPEDDQLAVDLMLKIFLQDEPLTKSIELSKDEASVRSAREYWEEGVKQRMTLACYCYPNGQRKLAAMNCCTVHSADDPPVDKSKVVPWLLDLMMGFWINRELFIGTLEAIWIEGACWRLMFGLLCYFEESTDLFAEFGAKEYLSGSGLLVLPEYRGEKLGAIVLNAREPMCRQQGIKATATMFSGPASQKSAENCGFKTRFALTVGEIAELGYIFNIDKSKVVKYMVKTYDY